MMNLRNATGKVTHNVPADFPTAETPGRTE